MEETTSETPSTASPSKKSGYGKRPLWQWILLYIIIGGIVYFLLYYFVLAKPAGGTAGSQGSPYNYSK